MTQFRARLAGNRAVGEYRHLVFVTSADIGMVKPGHFAAVAVGGPDSAMLLRRAFSIHRVSSKANVGTTIELIVSAKGAGTRWLTSQHEGVLVDMVAPLGKPFQLPKERVPCVLVAGGYGAAPMITLAEELRSRGCRVDVVLGASTESKLYGVLDLKRISDSIVITTDDGSLGVRGRVSDVLPEVMQRADSAVVYACGPMGMLQAVSLVAASTGAIAQCAVEESMACGVGVCMTCVLPVIGDDGRTRMVRACTEGPVFRGDRVRWDAIGSVPADAVGAPPAGGH
ncbi:MAG: dihydroorotate dehydrogenase electron transfer subunit [Candidatus Nanopelagicales bacterium]